MRSRVGRVAFGAGVRAAPRPGAWTPWAGRSTARRCRRGNPRPRSQGHPTCSRAGGSPSRWPPRAVDRRPRDRWQGPALGIFSGSGVGKSTLLAWWRANTSADVNVIALIGERGREGGSSSRTTWGPRARPVRGRGLHVQQAAPGRVRGAFVATAIAEFFRDQGRDAMLLFDSVTRFAWLSGRSDWRSASRRQPWLHPFGVHLLPKLLEAGGTSDRGSITAFYTILVEGDDMTSRSPTRFAGARRPHRALPGPGRAHALPAIDVLRSISRLAIKVTSPRTRKAAPPSSASWPCTPRRRT